MSARREMPRYNGICPKARISSLDRYLRESKTCLVSDVRFSYTLVRMNHPGAEINTFAKKEHSRAPFVISRSLNTILGRVVASGTLERVINLKISFHSSIGNICRKEHAEVYAPEGRQRLAYVRSRDTLF